ncbi:acyltransferase [Staphylococcus hominis]|uniref:acyltransferase n=1 Tax=Staphylococcus hominis TaxID=1290 RepID=UPI001F16A68E|nr:acyltransferase [Staphylococcus hominis]MCE4990026.1 acyltransferase [Staphylococcus hominis]MCT1483494.1 acyltransferase [Staphylococcus hominis]
MSNIALNNFLEIVQIPYKFLPKSICNFIWEVSSVNDSLIAIIYRRLYMQKYAKKVGANIYIGKYVVIKNIHNLRIGNNVSIHSFSYVDAYGEIDIGNNVSIANHSTLISSDHTWEDRCKPIKYNKIKAKKIIIDDDVWIAAGVRILGGIKIRKRCIIGAGSVVNKDTEPNSLYVGIPIKKIKEANSK